MNRTMLTFSQNELEKILYSALEQREADGLDDPQTVRLILRKLSLKASASKVEHFVSKPTKTVQMNSKPITTKPTVAIDCPTTLTKGV